MPPGETGEIGKKLVWHDEHHLQIGDTNFFLTLDWETADTTESTPEQFVLVKDQYLTQTTLDHLPARIDNMIEFGIFKGGSIALYEELLSPKRLVGVDIKSERVEALDEYLERRSATDRVRLYYGVDQQDRQALNTIVRENFAAGSLDLVVDDGSHRYEPTKESLNLFLPLVRPSGGVYLIEDWAWAHWLRDRPDSDQFDDETNPLSKLIFEVVMFGASHPGVIREVLIDASRAFIVRGREAMASKDFNIGNEYRTSIWSFDFAETVDDPIDPDPASTPDGESTSGSSGKLALTNVWRSWVPLSIRRRVPSKLGAWAQEHLPRSSPGGT